MSEKSNRAIVLLVLVLAVVVLVSCASLVAGSTVFGAEPVVSPTRRPIKTPTSAPTEQPKPTSPPDTENVQFLPLILNSGDLPKHDYPSIENCRIVASPMEDLIDMCCGLYDLLCEYIPTPEVTQ